MNSTMAMTNDADTKGSSMQQIVWASALGTAVKTCHRCTSPVAHPGANPWYCQVGIYAGRVMRAVKFEFIINLQTAKTLGIAIRPGLLAIADEVIE